MAKPKIKGALSPADCFQRALKRNSHALAEMRETQNMVNVGYGGQHSEATRLINAAEEILLVAHRLIERERDHHRAEERRQQDEAEAARPDASFSHLTPRNFED